MQPLSNPGKNLRLINTKKGGKYLKISHTQAELLTPKSKRVSVIDQSFQGGQ